MTRGHCHDWFRKWKREHNFCGLRPQDAKELEFVERVMRIEQLNTVEEALS